MKVDSDDGKTNAYSLMLSLQLTTISVLLLIGVHAMIANPEYVGNSLRIYNLSLRSADDIVQLINSEHFISQYEPCYVVDLYFSNKYRQCICTTIASRDKQIRSECDV